MKARVLILFAAAAGLLPPSIAIAQTNGQGQAIVTVLPKHEGEIAPAVSQQDLQSVKVNGKAVKVTSWSALNRPQDAVELVLLIDDSARGSFGRQFQDIEQFVRSLPPNVKAVIGYMQNGRAAISGALSANHDEVLHALRLPIGSAGGNASPYFCLSDLAKSWPSQDRAVRRDVIVVTDGVDNYNRRLDTDDPYVEAAINDAVRAGMTVYSIYWRSKGAFDATLEGSNAGQSLLAEVTQGTGGQSFAQGIGNPVSFAPYLDEVLRRLRNQYELSFEAPAGNKPAVENLRIKLSVPGSQVTAPEKVLVIPSGSPAK